jgi:hypothetical protein
MREFLRRVVVKHRNQPKTSMATQVENVERATWFARLALGDWATTPVPEPAKTHGSTFHVLP